MLVVVLWQRIAGLWHATLLPRLQRPRRVEPARAIHASVALGEGDRSLLRDSIQVSSWLRPRQRPRPTRC